MSVEGAGSTPIDGHAAYWRAADRAVQALGNDIVDLAAIAHAADVAAVLATRQYRGHPADLVNAGWRDKARHWRRISDAAALLDEGRQGVRPPVVTGGRD